MWQAVRNISSDDTKLKSLCYQAHKKTGAPLTDTIDTVVFEQKTITFTAYNNSALNRDPLVVDVVSYNVTRQPTEESPKRHFFYFTKGAKKGCIFYLIKWRKKRNPIFRIGVHYCDVEVPE